MNEESKIHQCPTLPVNGIEVIYSRSGNEIEIKDLDSVWNLTIRRESTAEDLEENHYLEEVGEILWETVLQISHCPFCGESLYNGSSKCEGKFVHRDSSSWSM